jgi:hypothetical protein
MSDAKVAVNGKVYLHIAQWRPRLSGKPGLDRDWPDALSVIHCPDVRGTACGFELYGQTLFGKKGNSLMPAHDQRQVSDAFRLQVLAQSRKICRGDSTQVWAFGAGAERFSWRILSGPIGWQQSARLRADTGASAWFTSLLAGSYTISVRGQSRCSIKDTSLILEVINTPIAKAVSKITTAQTLIAYPIPTNGSLTVHTRGKAPLLLCTPTGQVVHTSQPSPDGTTMLDLAPYPPGLYFLRQGQVTIKVVRN